jgi:hypothetical protein
MVNVHGMARLGVLAVGLGIGAAWAQTPVASADSSSDWSSTIDSLLSGASPAPATPIDLDISFDGYTIYASGSAYAYTPTGDCSLAIADGDNAAAYADGTGGSAIADGSGADAYSAGGTGDVAEAVGTNANAEAGGYSNDSGANYDTAIDIGNNTNGGDDGAYAGSAALAGGGSGTGAHDTAIDIGNNSGGGDDGAFAGGGGLIDKGSGDGNNDTAIDVGNNSGLSDGSYSLDGNGNYASESGGATRDYQYAYAGQGNDNTAVGTTDNALVEALQGNDNYAYVDGPARSSALAFDGDSNIASVNDPFDAAGSPDNAQAGNGFSNDLAEVLLTHGDASALGANLAYDIISLFGNFSGSF